MSRDRSVDRHEQFEELISASLSGDLTSDERRRLDAHLDTCETCRATLAAFADQRRMVAGLRHVPVPHDLDARVRAGVERAAVPWWRRPRTILLGATGGLAVVAGALLALVLLDTPADEPQVGEATPSVTPSFVSVPSETPIPTLPPSSPKPSSAATPTPQPSEPASPAATPAPTPIPVSPEPAVFVAVTGDFDNQAMTVRDGTTGATVGELEAPSGEPIAAELSPDGQWLAYITTVGLSGMNEVRATRIADESESEEQTVVLGRSMAGSPFLERLFWSPDSRYLASPLLDSRRLWLYNAHKQARGLSDGQPPIDAEGYRDFLVSTCCDSFELRYRLDGELMGVAIVDRSRHALSAVYCYYDPDCERLSIGTFSS